MFENFIGLKIAYEKTKKAKPTAYQHTTPTGESTKEDAGLSLDKRGSTNEDAKQTIQPPNQSAGKPTDADKTEPESINYELAERMAVEGESCEPDQVKPYVTGFDVLVIPSNGDPKYHYWNGGQTICDTLRELGRCDLIEKYTHPDYFGGN